MQRAASEKYVKKLRPEDLAAVQCAAHAFGLRRTLLLTLLLQESQFYHGTRFEGLCTTGFLAARNLPIARFRQKSFGITSIKPRTAKRLMEGFLNTVVDERSAARAVAKQHHLAIWLAAAELSSYRARGADGRTAFLAYAATPATVELLLHQPHVVLNNSKRFRRRSADYAFYTQTANALLNAPDLDFG